jgi:uncharacterized membrane protein YciS (DUF1049 family)
MDLNKILLIIVWVIITIIIALGFGLDNKTHTAIAYCNAKHGVMIIADGKQTCVRDDIIIK